MLIPQDDIEAINQALLEIAQAANLQGTAAQFDETLKRLRTGDSQLRKYVADAIAEYIAYQAISSIPRGT